MRRSIKQSTRNREVYDPGRSQIAMKAIRDAVLFLACVPLLVTAKGPTLKITIKGSDLVAPIEITEKGILEKFNVWAGAGVEINGITQTKGFIVDWERGRLPSHRRHCVDMKFRLM